MTVASRRAVRHPATSGYAPRTRLREPAAKRQLFAGHDARGATPVDRSPAYADRVDRVTFHECVHRVQSARYRTENRVMPGQMRLRGKRQEVLAATRVRTRQGHPHSAAGIRQQCELVANRVARTALAIAARITVLCDEAGNHAMESQVVVCVPVGERGKIENGERRLHSIERDDDTPAYRAQCRSWRVSAQRRQHYTTHDVLVPLEWTLDLGRVE